MYIVVLAFFGNPMYTSYSVVNKYALIIVNYSLEFVY